MVDSQVLVANLNVEFLGGNRAADFSLAAHDHPASKIVSGTFAVARMGSGSPAATSFLSNSGGFGLWRGVLLSDLGEMSDLGKSFVTTNDAAVARGVIQAAAATHTHNAAAVTAGVFEIARLGSAAVGSGSKYLRGGPADNSQGQWAQIAASEVSGAARFTSAPNDATIPIWDGNQGVLKSSQLYALPGFIAVAPGTAFAIADNGIYLGGVKLPMPPSDTSLYGLRANGPTGAAWEVIGSISVGLSGIASFISVSGTPITSSGTLALSLANQSANRVFAGPASGSTTTPTFRLLVVDDIPQLPVSKVTNAVPDSRTVSGANSLTGGGDLTANRTISLVNDATPAVSQYYGTNSSSTTRGWHNLPTGSGTAGPTSPANAVYVWVVNADADGGDWLQLTGAT